MSRLDGARPWLRRRLRGAAILAAVALLVSLAGCGPNGAVAEAHPRGIVLISVDAIRRDRLPVYGGKTAMPGLERLASLGTVFEDAATVCPMSRPAAVTLLTGLPPDRSGVRSDTLDALGADVGTLAERFGQSGRTTAAMVATPLVSYSSGLDRGFGLFDGPEELLVGQGRHQPAVRPGPEVASRFGDWLGTLSPDEPFFAWVHLSDLHGVAIGSESLDEAVAAYDEGLATTDGAIGAILDALASRGLLEGTAVVLAGTHGVLLGEPDGARGAAYWLTSGTLEVPLIVKAPGFEPGARSQAPVWLPDVAATLAALGGVEPGEGAEGIDLAAGASAREGRVRMAWTWAPDDEMAWPTLTAVREGEGWKVFRWDELSRAADGSPSGGALGEAIRRPATPRPREIPGDLERRMQAAGLVEGWAETSSPEPPAAERNELVAKLELVRHLLGHRQRGMRPINGGLLDAYPDNLGILVQRLYLVVRGGAIRRVGAKLAGHLVKLYPRRPEALHWAAHVALATGRMDDAELLLEAASAIVPRDPDVLYDQACVRARRDDTPGALEHLEQAIDAGFRNWEHIERDGDLASIRSDPGYARLLGSHGR